MSIKLSNGSDSLEVIQALIDIFNNIKDSKIDNIIEIDGEEELQHVDPLILSYLILFKAQFPELRISLCISKDNYKLDIQLKQLATYIYIITGLDVFGINYENSQYSKKYSLNFNSQNKFAHNWFVCSQDYFPILFLNKDFYVDTGLDVFSFLFERKLDKLSLDYTEIDIYNLPEEVKWVNNSEDLTKAYKEFLKQRSTPGNRQKASINLAKMHFITALDHAKIAHIFFSQESLTSTNAGNLIGDALSYYDEIKDTLIDLSNSSIVHQFFFSFILGSTLANNPDTQKKVLTQESRVHYIETIKSSWDFTLNLVSGIRELAKNIVQHADPTMGAISCRLFSVESWTRLRNAKDPDNIYGKYLKWLEGNRIAADSIIDINIVDMGKMGIIPSLTNNIGQLINTMRINPSEYKEKIVAELEKDMTALETREISLKNLINLSGRQLEHQRKRSIAHLGLLIFSKLIKDSSGMILLSSQNSNLNSGVETACSPEIFDKHDVSIKVGTLYNVILPVALGNRYKSRLPRKINIPYDVSASEIKGIEELFRYKLISVEKELDFFEPAPDTKYVFQIDLPIMHITERETERELWQYIDNSMQKLPYMKESQYAVCLNMNDIDGDESSLFRLLGNIELFYPDTPIIILNIRNDIYRQLLRYNNIHSRVTNMPFWNSNIATLIYSYEEMEDGARFYFADALWGDTRSDFFYLNFIINLSTMNSLSLLNKDEKAFIAAINEKREPIDPNTHIFFFNKHSLLPFELFLKNDKRTLFEINARILLQNELNPTI